MSTPIPGRGTDDPIADLRADVAAIKATLPHLATKAEVADLRAELKADIGDLRAELKAEIGGLKGYLGAQIERVDGNIARMEASMIKWIVGASIACTSVAFTAAKLVH